MSSPTPFVPDKEPRFILSIPFSTSPLIGVAESFPLPQLRATTQLTATASEQDVARQLLVRSPSPSLQSDQPNSHAHELDHRLQLKKPIIVKHLPHKRSRSPSTSSSYGQNSSSGESSAAHVDIESKKRLKSNQTFRDNKAYVSSAATGLAKAESESFLYACPHQKKIYHVGTFTWYEIQGHEPLLAPPAPPTDRKTIICDGDMMVYKLHDNSSAQAWLWDEDLNSGKWFWRTIKEGYIRDIHGRPYTFAFGKNFSPCWRSRETVRRRAVAARKAERE